MSPIAMTRWGMAAEAVADWIEVAVESAELSRLAVVVTRNAQCIACERCSLTAQRHSDTMNKNDQSHSAALPLSDWLSPVTEVANHHA